MQAIPHSGDAQAGPPASLQLPALVRILVRGAVCIQAWQASSATDASGSGSSVGDCVMVGRASGLGF